MTKHLAGRDYHLQPLYTDNFRNADGWLCEGVDAKLWTQDNWLCCDASAGGIPPAATIWCTAAKFSDPLWLEFDVRFFAGKFNANLILHGTDLGNGDILATSGERKGNYEEYHVFPNYILTFLNDQSATRIRYRRNPGFTLLGQSTYRPALQFNHTYHVALLLQSGRLQFFVNGIKRHETVDPSPPLTSGRLALRTWQTHLAWSNFAICRIIQ